MELELSKEWEVAKKLHITTYMFLHNFYTQNQLYDDDLHSKLKRYASILNDMEKYDENVYITSTYNLGCLINLFDPSEKAKEFLHFIKCEMIKKMKRLKYLSKNVYPDKLVQVSDENAEIVNNIQSIFDQQWTSLCTSSKKNTKKKKKKWSRGVLKNKNNKKKVKKDEAKTEEIEDYAISDEEEPQTESVFQNVDLNMDKERDVTLIKSMNQTFRNIETKTSYTNVSRLLQKLNLTSSTQDYSLRELQGLEEPDTLLLDYNDLKEKIYFDQESVGFETHLQDPYCTVGPFTVRRFDDEIVFYCTMEDESCKNWFTTKNNYLHRHIQALHSSVKMKWSCSLCPLIDTTFQTDLCDLENAFKHLMTWHIDSGNSGVKLLEKYQDRNRSFVPDKSHVCIKTKNPPKLFNCPYPNCKFTSDNEIESFNHMYDIFGDYESYQCTYCELKFFTNITFIGHIKDDHKFDRYRCAYCMYRSISKNNVIYHQMNEHLSNSVKVLESKSSLDPPKIEDVISQMTIQPYMCMKKGCSFKTSIVKKFIEHLNEHSDAYYACQSKYCSYVNVPSAILEHLLEHGIGEYQCFVCPYATNNRPAIRRHMYSTHSSKLPLCFQRVAYEDSAKICERYKIFLTHSVLDEDIVLLDLDSCVIEENIEHEVVDAKEYEKMVDMQSTIGLNLKEDEEKANIIDNIELSSDEEVPKRDYKNIIKPSRFVPEVIELDSDEEPPKKIIKTVKVVQKITPKLVNNQPKKEIKIKRIINIPSTFCGTNNKFIKILPAKASTSMVKLISPNTKVSILPPVQMSDPSEDPLAINTKTRQVAKKSTTKNGS